MLREPSPAGIPGVPTLEELGMAPSDIAGGGSARPSAQPKTLGANGATTATTTSTATTTATAVTAPTDELGLLADQLLTDEQTPLGRLNLPLTAAEEAEFNGLVDELLPEDREKMGFGTKADRNANAQSNTIANAANAANALSPPAPDYSDLPTEIPPTYDEVVAMETAGADPASVQGAQLLRAYSHWIDRDTDDPTALMKGLNGVIARLAEPPPSAWQNVKRAVLGRAKPVEPLTLQGDMLTRLMAGVRRIGDGFVASDPVLPPKEFRQERMAYLEDKITSALQAGMDQLTPAEQKRAIARMKDEQNDIWRGLRNSAEALGRQRALTNLGPSASEFIVETGQMHDLLMRAMKRVSGQEASPQATTGA